LKAFMSRPPRWKEMIEGVHDGLGARANKVNASNKSSRCLINEHLRSIYRGDQSS
jgi:hypothetical protein